MDDEARTCCERTRHVERSAALLLGTFHTRTCLQRERPDMTVFTLLDITTTFVKFALTQGKNYS